MNKNISYAFFGTGPLAESVLAALYKGGYIPSLIVTKQDAPSGRHMVMTEPYIKTWGKMKGIDVFQPETLRDLPKDSPLHLKAFDVFIVASYGKIIPDDILALPKKGALNVHPSLLPKYRGPSPIESALLEGDMMTGVTIIKLDSEMDHGPILLQNALTILPEMTAGSVEVLGGQMGGAMLVESLSHYVDGTLIPKEQDHAQAIFCKKITKDMGEISLNDDIALVRRKYRALTPWPGLYFFIEHAGKKIRVKINSIDLVSIKDSTNVQDYIIAVTPEGKKEMDWESFKRGYVQ